MEEGNDLRQVPQYQVMEAEWVGSAGWRQLPIPGSEWQVPGHLGVSLAEHSHFGRICPLVPGMGFMDLTTAHRAVDLLFTQFCWNFRNF